MLLIDIIILITIVITVVIVLSNDLHEEKRDKTFDFTRRIVPLKPMECLKLVEPVELVECIECVQSNQSKERTGVRRPIHRETMFHAMHQDLRR
jgi:hypothetical protein